MTDIQILEQLLNGNHLSESELKKAHDLLIRLNLELKARQLES